jgi:hypothetical protein
MSNYHVSAADSVWEDFAFPFLEISAAASATDDNAIGWVGLGIFPAWEVDWMIRLR